jgi:8-oxo-dGTP diphosphatase
MRTIFCSSGIILNNNKEILINSRKNKNFLKSYWEFPGGKLKNTENSYQALVREVKEELNIKIKISDIVPLTFVRHKYRNFHLFMHVFKVKKWSGDISSYDNEELKWVKSSKLKQQKILPANKDIIKLLI